jgi:hypothetical protein
MLNRNKTRYGTLSAVIGLLTVFLTVLYPTVSFADEGGGYSGDDPYDPAAGGQPEKSLSTSLQRSTSTAASTHSGDDAYDPAAGGQPEMSLATRVQPSTPMTANTYSGDDAYDPAAGGTPFIDDPAFSAGRSNRGIVAAEARERASVRFIDDPGLSAAVEVTGDESVRFIDDPALSAAEALASDCGLSADEISRRSALEVPGGFSGDDAYDPAAGGTPELSLLPFAEDPGLLAACTPSLSGN